jgi:hypothetical protein
MPSELTTAYVGVNGQVEWSGVELTDDIVSALCDGRLQERLLDQTYQDEVIAELQALATTEMASETIHDLLASQEPPVAWEVGEALAEVLLEVHHHAVWPANSVRDRKTPKASLPGADLVGFVETPGGAKLLFGEVKTSSDVNSPPGVVYGRSGLINQLDNLARQTRLHFALLKWLKCRCITPEHIAMYKEAAARYVASRGCDVRLMGCLMRDTPPNELDLKARALALSGNLTSPTGVKLIAWHLPKPVSAWSAWLEVSA